MSQPVSIIGAGIAGLILSRCLLHRGIPSIIYETATSKSRYNYAISLHASAYQPLLEILGITESSFKSHVAVDAATGGAGDIGRDVNLPSYDGLYDISSSFRANRSKLETLLRERIDIRWRHRLQSIKPTPQGSRLQFDQAESCSAQLVIGADGVGSSTRRLLLPSARIDVLPYVVFNGQRRVVKKTLTKHYAAALKESSVLELQRGDIALNVSLNDGRSDQETFISWTYSRPARGVSDPLHRPERASEVARQIPSEFFEEIAAFEDLPSPFSDAFNLIKLRKDRVLHWLMRTTSAPLPDLQDLLAKSGVCLMGDAVHAEPIVGGYGANAAIIDALTLADAIASGEQNGISGWYDKRYPVWMRGLEESRRNIAKIHEPPKQQVMERGERRSLFNFIRKA
jgi:tyrosinase